MRFGEPDSVQTALSMFTLIDAHEERNALATAQNLWRWSFIHVFLFANNDTAVTEQEVVRVLYEVPMLVRANRFLGTLSKSMALFYDGGTAGYYPIADVLYRSAHIRITAQEIVYSTAS